MRIPDGIAPIEAWRMWLIWGEVTAEGPMARIGSRPRPGYMWPPLIAEPAMCRREGSNHRAPASGGKCGYYGLRSDSFVDMAARRASAPYAVLGKVYLWGKVIVASKGWRAQFAYPAALYLAADGPWHEGELTKYVGDLCAYGVPVEVRTFRDVIDLVRATVA